MGLRTELQDVWSEIRPNGADSLTESGPNSPLAGIPTSPDSAARSEDRERVVHVVEYSRYPRRDPEQARRVAYTQDRSTKGLGLDLPERVDPGELLRVTLRDIDGGVAIDGLARVVWCRSDENGRTHAGLAMLRDQSDRPMRRVRSGADGSRMARVSVRKATSNTKSTSRSR